MIARQLHANVLDKGDCSADARKVEIPAGQYDVPGDILYSGYDEWKVHGNDRRKVLTGSGAVVVEVAMAKVAMEATTRAMKRVESIGDDFATSMIKGDEPGLCCRLAQHLYYWLVRTATRNGTMQM